MRFVCMADTHTLHDNVKIPDGDVLIHAGDFTNIGEFRDIVRFNEFLGRLPHKYKIVIAGNHDFSFQNSPEDARFFLKNCIYLQDSEVTIEGIRIYGSPWSPIFMNWAFMLTTAELKQKWNKIPQGIDVLVTHCPPYGILDRNLSEQHCGCKELLKAVNILKPKFHIFGHLHREWGKIEQDSTTFINSSICDEEYNPTREPIVFDILDPVCKKDC